MITQTTAVAEIPKTKRKMDKTRFKKYAFKYIVSAVRWLFILGMCFVVLYPLLQQISASFMSVDDMYDATVTYLPKNPTFSNYTYAWTKLGGWSVFLQTLGLTLSCALLNVVSATLTGYGLARFKFKGRGIVFGAMIMAMLLPPDLLFTPRYSMFVSIGQIGDSPLSILCFAATCTGLKCSLYIFMMRQFFRGMPKELEEAAYVDGAGPARTFITIMLPSAVSMMVTVFLFAFVWQWLDMKWVTVFMHEAKLIANNVSLLIDTAALSGASVQVNASLIRNAGIVIIIAPLLVLYAFTQKFFVESISRSGLVG